MPDATAGRLLTYLHAWTNPRRSDGSDASGGDQSAVPYSTRLGHAFCALAGAPRPDHAPPPRWDHDRGRDHHGLRHPRQRAGGRDHRHRPPHQRLRSPAPGLQRRPHPRRPGWHGPRSSTSAGRSGSTRTARDARWTSATSTAVPRDATSPPPGAKAHHLIPWSEGGKTDLADGAPALLPPPPPGPRRPLPPRPTPERRPEVPPPQIDGVGVPPVLLIAASHTMSGLATGPVRSGWTDPCCPGRRSRGCEVDTGRGRSVAPRRSGASTGAPDRGGCHPVRPSVEPSR